MRGSAAAPSTLVTFPVGSGGIGQQRIPGLPCPLLLLLTLWSLVAFSMAQYLEHPHQFRSQQGLAGKLDLMPPAEVELRGDRKLEVPEASIAPELDFLAEFAGKHRLWVITAPSYTDNYLLMMEKQIQDMEPEGLSCRLAERDTLIVTIIQNAMMEGKIRRPAFQGGATEEVIDPDTVTKLLHYLEMEDQTFSMVILKKNLKVSERFPYPVRVEAVLEVIDQLPMRKLEKMTRKGSTERCKVLKKRVIVRKRGPKKKIVFSPQRQGNFTLVPKQRKPLDKKAALRSKVQDILSGRSRFVIRKASVGPKGTQISATDGTDPRSGGANTQKQDNEKKSNGDRDTVSEGGRADKSDPAAEVEERRNGEVDSKAENSSSKSKSKKKGKGKKKDGKKKKGKRGGKKSQRDANEKEKKVLKVFLEKFQEKRRLLVITAPNENSPQYIQQRGENEQNHCELALRKVSMIAILGSEHSSSLYLQHYRQDTEPSFDSEKSTDPELISQIRKEYGIPPKGFSLVITDYDLKPKKLFEAPITSSVMMDYIDLFPSRQPEKEREKSKQVSCSTLEQQGNAESSLLRFMSKRRLLIISTPSEDDYSYQQQLQALNGQACPMGIRHFALLKLVGAGPVASGSVELFPLNGKSQSENEPLSADMVNGLRGHLKINRDYFNMLVVGKDGDVKAWFPSPMWSLANIYDLVDSLELRQQEQRLQQALGIHCPEDTSSSFHGYEDLGEEGYLYHRSED